MDLCPRCDELIFDQRPGDSQEFAHRYLPCEPEKRAARIIAWEELHPGMINEDVLKEVLGL